MCSRWATWWARGPGHPGLPPAGGQAGGGHPLHRGQRRERLRRGPHPRQARGCMMPGPTSSPWATTPGTASRSPTFWKKTPISSARPTMPAGCRAGASGVFDGPGGLRIGVMNLMGRLELNSNLDSPLQDRQPAAAGGAEAQRCDLVLVDFHAEATSERGAGLVSGRAGPGPVGDPHPCAHGGRADPAQGDGLPHRPGHDGGRGALCWASSRSCP